MRAHALRRLQTIGISATIALVTLGCGSPDFATMKPTVAKPSAAVILVNHPVGWTSGLVGQMQQSDSKLSALTLETVSTSLQQLNAQVQRLLASRTTPTLIVEVFPGAVPASAMAVAAKHVGVRFQYVGTTAPTPTGVNAASLGPDPQITAYLTGWMAGFANQEKGHHVIGWLNNTGVKPNASLAKAMLAGLYTADPTAVVTPVSVPAQLGSTGNTMNSTSNVPPSQINVPAVNVELDPLSSANAAVLSGAHAQVFSAASVPSGPVDSVPVPPGPVSLQPDLENLIHNRWSPGARTVTAQQTSIWVSPTKLSATAKAALQNLEQTGISGSDVTSGWAAIPTAKQLQWQQLVGF